MVNTLEAAAKAPTVYEEASAEYEAIARLEGIPVDCPMAAAARMITALAQELADERAIVRDQGAIIAELGTAVASIRDANAMRDQAFTALDWAVNHLQPCAELPVMTTLESVTADPTIRVRINHALRGKLPSGWSFNEGTIEWCGPKDDLTESELIDIALTAGNAAERISAIRNASSPTESDDQP